VSGPLLLASISKGSESPDSYSEESESPDLVSDDSDSDDSESSGPVPSGLISLASASEGSRSSSGSGEQWPQESKQSVPLSLSEEPEEDSEPPSVPSSALNPRLVCLLRQSVRRRAL
jgi:hypothetical protein